MLISSLLGVEVKNQLVSAPGRELCSKICRVLVEVLQKSLAKARGCTWSCRIPSLCEMHEIRWPCAYNGPILTCALSLLFPLVLLVSFAVMPASQAKPLRTQVCVSPKRNPELQSFKRDYSHSLLFRSSLRISNCCSYKIRSAGLVILSANPDMHSMKEKTRTDPQYNYMVSYYTLRSSCLCLCEPSIHLLLGASSPRSMC